MKKILIFSVILLTSSACTKDKAPTSTEAQIESTYDPLIGEWELQYSIYGYNYMKKNVASSSKTILLFDDNANIKLIDSSGLELIKVNDIITLTKKPLSGNTLNIILKLNQVENKFFNLVFNQDTLLFTNFDLDIDPSLMICNESLNLIYHVYRKI